MPRDSRSTSLRCCLILFLSVASITAAHAEIYKWTDKSGGVHFSEQPPAGVNYETVNPRYAPGTTAPAPPPKSEPQDSQQQADDARMQKEQQFKAEEERVRQQNCEMVQKRLEQLQTFTRINVQQEDGSVRHLTEEERQARIAKTQDLVNKYCQ